MHARLKIKLLFNTVSLSSFLSYTQNINIQALDLRVRKYTTSESVWKEVALMLLSFIFAKVGVGNFVAGLQFVSVF